MRFEYVAPSTLEETLSLLSTCGEEAQVLAGGTDLVLKMRDQTLAPRYVIHIGRLMDLNYICDADDDGIQIGTLTPIRDLERSSLLQTRCSLVSEAAGTLADPTIRNVATIGGNLCNAAPSADMAPALIALAARVKLVSSAGERVIPLEAFFTGPGMSVRRADELLTEIQVPAQPDHSTGIYLKHSQRAAADLAVVGVAVILTQDPGTGVCTDAKIVLGAVAPTPIRAREAEKLLKGQRPEGGLIERVAQAASDESRPIDDVRGSAWYRRKMVMFLVGEAITQITEQFSISETIRQITESDESAP